MSNGAGSPTPAGWFRDPGGSDQLRWWDGTAWTSHLAAAPVAQPAPPAVAVVPAAAPPATQPAPPLQPAPPSTPGLTPPPVGEASLGPTPMVTAPVFAPEPTVSQPTLEQSQNFVPAKDPAERPYVPFQNTWSSTSSGAGPYGGSGYGSAEYAQPTGWNTGGGWFVATSLLWTGILEVGAAFALVQLYGLSNLTTNGTLTSTGNSVSIASGVIIWLLLVFAAARDQSTLRRRGFTKPTSPLWMLLIPPLVYLIIRTVRLRAESGHGQAPLIFYLVSWASIVALSIAAAVSIPAFLATAHIGTSLTRTNSQNASSLASGIATGLNNGKNSFSVTCTPFAKPAASATVDVTCIAVDLSSKATHTLIIGITGSASGADSTVKLLSVNPPIAGSGS